MEPPAGPRESHSQPVGTCLYYIPRSGGAVCMRGCRGLEPLFFPLATPLEALESNRQRLLLRDLKGLLCRTVGRFRRLPALPELLGANVGAAGRKDGAMEGSLRAPWLVSMARALRDTPGESSAFADAPPADAPLLEGFLKKGIS